MINVMLSSLGKDEDGPESGGDDDDANKERSRAEASAGRCKDLLQQLGLLYGQHMNEAASLRPTGVTFEFIAGALSLVAHIIPLQSRFHSFN